MAGNDGQVLTAVDAEDAQFQDAASGGGVPPYTDYSWVNSTVTIPDDERDGSIGKPYTLAQDAIDAAVNDPPGREQTNITCVLTSVSPGDVRVIDGKVVNLVCEAAELGISNLVLQGTCVCNVSAFSCPFTEIAAIDFAATPAGGTAELILTGLFLLTGITSSDATKEGSIWLLGPLNNDNGIGAGVGNISFPLGQVVIENSTYTGTALACSFLTMTNAAVAGAGPNITMHAGGQAVFNDTTFSGSGAHTLTVASGGCLFRNCSFPAGANLTVDNAAGVAVFDSFSWFNFVQGGCVLSTPANVHVQSRGASKTTIAVAVPALVAAASGYVNVDVSGIPILAGIAVGDPVVVNPTDDITAAGAGNGGFINARVSALNTVRLLFIGTTAAASHNFTIARP